GAATDGCELAPSGSSARRKLRERYPDAFICAVEDERSVRTAESAMLRFPRRAVARFVALLRSDVAGVRAGFFALLISSGGDLVTGLTLASITHTLTELARSEERRVGKELTARCAH